MNQLNKFKKTDIKNQEKTYGGYAWLILVPYILQSVVTAVASFKSIFSEKGNIKGKDISAQWDNGSAKTVTSKEPERIINYFAY